MIYLKDGNIPLNLAYDDDIVQEANSTYQLSFKFPLTDGKWNLLKREVLLLADDLHGEQEFFIFEAKKANGYVQVYAKQVATLLNYYSINTISVDRGPGQMVMTALAGSVKRPCPFTFFSDILDRHTFNESDVSVMDALAKEKHSILGQWGGDLVRDKYQVKLLKNGGNENESLFMYKKNLSSYEETENISGLKTRLHLKKVIKGQSEGEEDRVLTVTVDSPLIGQYSQIYEVDIEVNDQDVTDEASLLSYGQRYFSSTLCDLVENSINLDVKGKSDVAVKMFDTVSVFHEQFDVDLRLKITSYHFAPMSKRLKTIGFGKVSQSFGSTVASMVAGSVDKATGRLSASFERKLQKEIDNANRHFDAEFEKRVEEINDGIEQSKAEAERYADAIKQEISTEINDLDTAMLAQAQEHDRQVADILSKTQSVEALANQAKSDAASAIARANQVKTEAIADARAQVATVNQALNTAKSELQTAIASADQKARDSQASATALRNDLSLQANKILAQAQAQTALTNRVTTVETLADGTRSTVADLSRTMNEATQTIASVTSRTKTVEDTLTQTRTQYEALTQTVNAQTGQIDSINRRTGTIETGLAGVQERFESLQVGGTNYIRDFGFAISHTFMNYRSAWQYERIADPTAHSGYHIKATCTQAGGGGFYKRFFELKGAEWQGRTMTYAVDIKCSKPVRILFAPEAFDDYATQIANVNVEWQRFISSNKVRFRVNNAYTFYIHGGKWEVGDVIYIRDPQLEDGNIATTPHAAEEDLRSEIATYKRTAEEFSAELSRQIQLADGKAVEAKTYAQQTADAIKTRLESLEIYKNAEGDRAEQYLTASREETARQLTAERTAIATNYVAKSTFEENARGVTQRFESLQVGGRNLLASKYLTNITTSERFTLKGWASTFINSANLRNIFKAGKTYTLSFDAKILAKSSISKLYYRQVGFLLYSRSTNRNINLYVNSLQNANDSVRFELTFVCPEMADDHCVYFYTNRYADGTSIDYDTVEFSNVNLMTGNIVSKSWIMPQEDQQTYADTKIAEYKNTVDGQFVNLQTQVNDKATQSDVDGLSGRLSTAETSIRTQAGQIEQRLTSTQVEQAITGKGYQTKTQVDNNITGRGYITSSALQPYALSTTVQNLVKETSDSFSRTISRVESKIPTKIDGTNLLQGTASDWKTIRVTQYNGPIKIYNSQEWASLNIKTGDSVTFSIDVKTTSGKKLRSRITFYGANKHYYSDAFIINGEGRLSVTGVVPEGITSVHLFVDANLTATSKTDVTVESYRKEQLEIGAVPTDWSPAPEDLATVTALHSVRDTVDSHTRTIGAIGETGSILDNVSKVTQTANGLVQEVTGEGGLKTQVSQLKNSWAVKNLSSSGQIIQQINLAEDGFLVDAAKIRLKGKTLVDEIQAIDGKFGTLFVADGTFSKLKSTVISAKTITGEHILFDKAFFDKMLADEALFKTIYSKNAFLTAVQAVTLSASKIQGGVLEAVNSAMKMDLNNANITFNQNATINFNSANNALVRRKGTHTAFVHFNDVMSSSDGGVGSLYASIGVTSSGDGIDSESSGRFAGLRAFRGARGLTHNATLDQLELYGDRVLLMDDFDLNRGFMFRPAALSRDDFIDMNQLVTCVRALRDIWAHYKNSNGTLSDLLNNRSNSSVNASWENMHSFK